MSNFNPLKKTINKTHLRARPGPITIKASTSQSMKMLPLNGVQKKVQTPVKAMTSRVVTEPPKRLSTVVRNSKMKEFEENLPTECYFKNEKMSELPRDPVKLIKLKLIKDLTEQNLKREIQRLANMNQSQQNRNRIFQMNEKVRRLDQAKIFKEGKLKSIRDRFQQVQNNPNQGGKGEID